MNVVAQSVRARTRRLPERRRQPDDGLPIRSQFPAALACHNDCSDVTSPSSCTRSPGTRSNSRGVLAATRVAPLRRACAAMKDATGLDRRPLGLQILRGFPRVIGVRGLEGDHCDPTGEKRLELKVGRGAPAAFGVAVAHRAARSPAGRSRGRASSAPRSDREFSRLADQPGR